MGGEVECISKAPHAQCMAVVTLPIAGGVRSFPVPISIGQGRSMRESSRSAGGAVTECDPVVRGGNGCDSGHEIAKIGMGSGGTGSSKVNSVSAGGQCSNERRSSWGGSG